MEIVQHVLISAATVSARVCELGGRDSGRGQPSRGGENSRANHGLIMLVRFAVDACQQAFGLCCNGDVELDWSAAAQAANQKAMDETIPPAFCYATALHTALHRLPAGHADSD